MRICSLLPSATEIVAELGLVDSLVGISEECDWPPEVRGLPVVTASRVDTTRLSSVEIDKAVREAVGDGRPLYAIDARDTPARPDPDPKPLRRLRRLRRQRRRAVRNRRRGRRPRRSHARRDRRAHPLSCRPARPVSTRPYRRRRDGREDRGGPRASGRGADAASIRRRVARPTVRRRPLDPRDGGDRRRPRHPRTRGRTFLPDLMGNGAGGAARTGRRRALWLRPSARSPRGDNAPLACRTVAVDSNAYYARPAPRLADGIAQLAFLIHPDLVDDPGLPYVELPTPTPPATAIPDPALEGSNRGWASR